MARSQWRSGAREIARSLSRARFLESLRILLPALNDGDIERGGSGVRAQAVSLDGRLVDDFHIQTAPGMVHVLNAPSPAATASLAIGREVADLLLR
jgi:L-2-hydroxyglutarate oxidase